MRDKKIVVVGAGPAGTRAAAQLVKHGCKVTVIHEGPHSGGQIYRRQPVGFSRPAEKLYGSEAEKAKSLHRAFDDLKSKITCLPDTTVWNIVGKELFLLGPDGVQTLAFDFLILATGAMDRVLPMPGWTLPGVFTLGAAQIALKHQACAIGRNTAFVGTGPLLYLVAYQYLQAGAGVVGVFDTSNSGKKYFAAPMMFANPRALNLGIQFRRALKKGGVPIHEGIVPLGVVGQGAVSGIKWRNANDSVESESCDAVAIGYGLKPESQLAELAGAKSRFDSAQRIWTIVHDGEGRIAPGVYAAGDGVNIGGADVAELLGEQAAWAVLKDMGQPVPPGRIRKIQRQLSVQRLFRRGLNAAFPVPVHQLQSLPDETILCRCENVTVGDARKAIDQFKPTDLNRLKAFCRTGMGRCQGRVCGLATAEIMAHRLSLPIESVGYLRGQSPIKPLAFSSAALLAEKNLLDEIAEFLSPEP